MLIGGAAPRKTDNERAPTGSCSSLFRTTPKRGLRRKLSSSRAAGYGAVTWHDGKAYGISYASMRPSDADLSTQLVSSDDGYKFEPLVAKLFDEGTPTEATLTIR